MLVKASRMIEQDLHELIKTVQHRGCEGQTTEVKAAHLGCPKRLYDTISAFSNQDDGGVLLFGLDEQDHFAKVGVYDAQDLQKKVMEYCEQMTPAVRPVFTVCDEEGLVFVSAEIPPIDIAERPCFNKGKGRLKGAYVRVGDADQPMTEYEVYSYEAFRKQYRDDIRAAEGVDLHMLDGDLLDSYMTRMRRERPNLSKMSIEQQYELDGITRNGKVTMTALLLFGLCPQAFYPRLCIAASCVSGLSKGDVDTNGNRFTDTKSIQGSIPEMLEKSLDFVQNHMSTAIRIDSLTGKRIEEPQYPMDAVREAVLNALIHRDYSMYTETRPILLDMYADRLEITNPGGLYGRLTVDQLGHVQPDTRNPVLVTAMETLGETENRYSGIPTMKRAMAEHFLPAPIFENRLEAFKVVLYHTQATAAKGEKTPPAAIEGERDLLTFCQTPRSRKEIKGYLHISSWQYAFQRYVAPLMQTGAIRMTIPDKPRSHSQKFVTVRPPSV